MKIKVKYIFWAAQACWLIGAVIGIVNELLNDSETYPILMWVFFGISLGLVAYALILREIGKRKTESTTNTSV